MEAVYLIAGPFTEYGRSAGAVETMALLRTPDEALADKYLETTAQYLDMYRKLIGPYPFTKFALVANFWETGYGMPSFTLLGERVIRLPFILHSSYPHELLHNYWGNGVYVDGNAGDNKFKAASYADIRMAFESVSGSDLKPFFEQWVERTGAPELQINNVSATSDAGQCRMKFTLKQRQAEAPFALDVPIAIRSENSVEITPVAMNQKEHTVELTCVARPLQVQVDPQFQLFRQPHPDESPPALPTILGAMEALIVLPAKAPLARRAAGAARLLARSALPPGEGQALPATLDDHAGAVVFGGPMRANHDARWPGLRTELDGISTVLT